jgi:hypothetical protein
MTRVIIGRKRRLFGIEPLAHSITCFIYENGGQSVMCFPKEGMIPRSDGLKTDLLSSIGTSRWTHTLSIEKHR